MTHRLLRILALAAGWAVALAALAAADPGASASEADDVVARSRAVYAALDSYADTGIVELEFGPAAASVRERAEFKTFYRAPRHYYFDFTKLDGDRFVVWSDDDAFHTWWKGNGLKQSYGRGRGAGAFAAGAALTKQSVLQISPWLFPLAGLVGTLTELSDVSLAGTEMVNGRHCHKVLGVAKSVYPATGHETNVRKTTVWIDIETLLVVRIFEDSPRGTPVGDVSRVTTTFQARDNPQLDDSHFRFAPPVQD
jgi:outer membrane lipoprotein-sorting protein